MQRGVSLVELMIGMAIGLAVIAGAVSFYTTNLKIGADNLKLGHLSGELRSAMLYMYREIRRAGYTGMEPGLDYDNDGDLDEADLEWLKYNPFFDKFDLQTGAATGEASNTCLMFSYNLDAAIEMAGAPPMPKVGVCATCSLGSSFAPYHVDNKPYDDDSMEIMGFRLSGGRLERRKSGTSGMDCVGNGDQWEDITSGEVEITTLQYSINTTALNVREPANPCESGKPCLYERSVGIVLEGRLLPLPLNDDGTVKTDEVIKLRLDEEIKIRNSKYVESAP